MGIGRLKAWSDVRRRLFRGQIQARAGQAGHARLPHAKRMRYGLSMTRHSQYLILTNHFLISDTATLISVVSDQIRTVSLTASSTSAPPLRRGCMTVHKVETFHQFHLGLIAG